VCSGAEIVPRGAARGLGEIQLAVLAGRGVNEHLARWSRRFVNPWKVEGPETIEEVPDARNRIFRAFRDRSDLPWLLMMDDDCVPVAETEELLETQADIAGPRIFARTGREAHQHCLSAACIKISRRAVEAIREPWFRFSRRGGCECSWFFNRAYQTGFRPVRAGLIGHRFPVVVLPGDDGPVFRFDSEIRGGQV